MEQQLVEVEEFFNARMSFTTLKKVIWRYIKTYNSATGATDEAFVWDECMGQYKSCSSTTKKCFPYIIRDLLDEIGARKDLLGLKGIRTDTSKSRLGKATSLLKCGIEIAVPSVKQNNLGRQITEGEVSTVLGSRFLQGGYYVAKYVRRAADDPDSESALIESVGELCRYGPFFVERAMVVYSPAQFALIVGKWIYRALKSERGKLLLKGIGQAYLAFVKYFLAVVSLSFNINVLAGNFKVDVRRLNELMDSFKARLLKFYGPFQIVFVTIYDFFSGYVQELVEKLKIYYVGGECLSGFFLFTVLGMIFAATFVVYVVVQEDILRKVQKLHLYLPINPGKTALGIFEQIGALLVIPIYLSIKSCVLFISGNWSDFYHLLNDDPSQTLTSLRLYTTATSACPNTSLAKVNHGFGIAALVLIVFFLFVCLPLLLLDLYSWVPISELEDGDKIEKLAHSHDRMDIKAAVHSNANLVEFHPIRALRPKTSGFFARHYDDYVTMSFRDRMKKYGLIGHFVMFINVYAHLMLQSIGRALGIFLGWRLRAEHMYPNPVMKSSSRWRIFDVFCLRFNVAWKVQYIKDKMVMPFVNICLVTLGLWGEPQWKEFNVEERANDCYRMEPSGEIKQLQMMSLHGKIVSLFWLCVPQTMVLAYLAEVLNRGPVLGYFLNRQFLQADIPESEREKDPVWRFHWVLAFKGEDDVVYLSDTRFYSTLLKWGSSIVEIVSLLMVYGAVAQDRTVLFGITLISAVVTPLLELNQQLIQAYMDYAETAENLAKSTGLVDKLEKAKKFVDAVNGALEEMPAVDVNTRAVVGVLHGKKGSSADEAAQVTDMQSDIGRVQAAEPATPAPGSEGVSSVVANNQSEVATHLASPNGKELRRGRSGRQSDTVESDKGQADVDESDNEPVPDQIEDDEGDDGGENQTDDVDNETALASLVASSGLVNTTKELIRLNAMPQICYVVMTESLEDGQGVVTVSWQVNARQRFHALDAIGMFPARVKGDLSIRTMDQCICYRLLKHQDVEPVGWCPKSESEDAERELIMLQARSLRDLTEREVSKMKKSIHGQTWQDDTEEELNARVEEHQNKLKEADSTVEKIMQDRELKPYKKKLPDILEDDIIANKVHERVPRTSRAYSLGAVAREEAAKRTRKVVSGQVKFRPANNCLKAKGDPNFETFSYGNDVGIYQSKHGLHEFEFCYLRCTDGETKVVGLTNAKENAKGSVAAKNQKVLPSGGVHTSSGTVSKSYEILERFVTNPIQIGTFDIFMNLTCDRPLLGAREKLNLSWIIYGVKYTTLSNPKMRNCIGFYKVNGSKVASCARIEIIPPSAYLEVGKNEPCPGRMTVTTPSDPGVYEIRFLFNFVKQAQLHRQCQVFGELEDEMQQLRIRSFYEKRAVTEELRKFSLREPNVWGIARMNTQVWLKAMLLSTIRESVELSVMESTSAYSDFLFNHLSRKFKAGLESPVPAWQRRIAQIVAPFRQNSFFDVLMVAFESSTQLTDQLASVTFMSPTEEDEKKRGLNKERDKLLLPSDKDVWLYANVSFHLLARNYLSQRSLCGYHDFVDDILLTHGQLMQTLDQTMDNLSSSCVTLYESAIAGAIEEMLETAKDLNLTAGTSKVVNLTNVLRGLDVMLMDLCRNHVQSMIRALFETDCRTGRKWGGVTKGPSEKLAALRAGTNAKADEEPSFEVVVSKGAARNAESDQLLDRGVPITREYIALRRWIWPKLQRKVVTILKLRHSRMMDGNWPIAVQLMTAVMSCLRPGLSLAGNPFPNHRKMKTASPLYFLEESRIKSKKKEELDRVIKPLYPESVAVVLDDDATEDDSPDGGNQSEAHGDGNEHGASGDEQNEGNAADDPGELGESGESDEPDDAVDDEQENNDEMDQHDEPDGFFEDSS